MYPTNPAAVILPVVERVAPTAGRSLLASSGAASRIDSESENQLRSLQHRLRVRCFARYDREVAAALFEPRNAYLRSLAAQTGPRDESITASSRLRGASIPGPPFHSWNH